MAMKLTTAQRDLLADLVKLAPIGTAVKVPYSMPLFRRLVRLEDAGAIEIIRTWPAKRDAELRVVAREAGQ